MNISKYCGRMNSLVYEQIDTSENIVINMLGYENLDTDFETNIPNGRKDYYFMYVTDGILSVYTENGGTVLLKKNMGCFYYAGHPYHYKNYTPHIFYYFVHFTGSQVEQILSRHGFCHEYIFRLVDDYSVISHLKMMIEEFTTRENDFVYSAYLYLCQIFLDIARWSDYPKKRSKTRKLNTSIKYLLENYTSDISVEQLAEMESLSISRFRFLFQSQFGASPKQYLIHLRVDYASNLLVQTDMSIENISSQCGFTDSTYFYRVFKQTKGLTPRKFRNSF